MWIEKNVETLVAIAAPILGAPRLLRSVITGFRNGLELFLSYDEMKHVCRTFGVSSLINISWKKVDTETQIR